MPMRREGRGMDGSESKRSKDSPVPWPTSVYVTSYSISCANQVPNNIPSIVPPSFKPAADIIFKASATQK